MAGTRARPSLESCCLWEGKAREEGTGGFVGREGHRWGLYWVLTTTISTAYYLLDKH
jgi:hypothetical protein